MAFQLTRFLDVQNVQELEPGGTFNLGAVNTSLFTGDIDYQDIPDGQEGFWLQEITGETARSCTSFAFMITHDVICRSNCQREHCHAPVRV